MDIYFYHFHMIKLKLLYLLYIYIINMKLIEILKNPKTKITLLSFPKILKKSKIEKLLKS